MKITNKHGLPQALVNACQQRKPTEGRISVSTLLTPPQIVYLARLHWDDIEEDVVDRVLSMGGTAMAEYLAKHAGEGTLAEVDFKVSIDGTIISFRPDLITGYTLIDYKWSSVWSVIYGKPEWAVQLNVYLALLAWVEGSK